MKFIKALTIAILILNLNIVNAQGLSNARVEQNRIYPLKEDNPHFVLSYVVKRRGAVETYLRSNRKTWELSDKRTEFAGKTNLKLSYSTIQRTLLSEPEASNKFSIEIIHLSARSKRSGITSPLSYKINAPFGDELFPAPEQPSLLAPPPEPTLLEYPPQPKLFSEKVSKHVVNPVSVISFLAGSAMAVFGQKITDEINGSSAHDIDPDHVIGVGVGVAVVSLGFWKKRKHDPVASEQNKFKNQKLIANWEREIRNKEIQNQKNKARWESENIKVETENRKILESYEEEVQRINKTNKTIKETYNIEINRRYD